MRPVLRPRWTFFPHRCIILKNISERRQTHVRPRKSRDSPGVRRDLPGSHSGLLPVCKIQGGALFLPSPAERLLAALFGEEPPASIEEKRAFLLRNHIAVWDVIASCEITGSSDSSIKNVVPNDLNRILDAADIRQIFCNGATSFNLYKKYCLPATNREAVKLPSTSPANAAFSLERLASLWAPVRDAAHF